MPIDVKFERAEPDDPNRCQAIVKNGQCPFKATEGVYCPMHTADFKKDSYSKKEVRNYRLAQWQHRISEFSDNEKVKSLREEIGILRIILESMLTTCKDADHLLLYASKISDLVLKIEKVVSSCHRLEQSTGDLLDKTSIIHLCSSIVEIIGKYVQDQSILDLIGNEIVLAIAKSSSLERNKNDKSS